MTTPTAATPVPATFVTPDALLRHWQGHRELTRRMIEAFPEQELFEYSVGGMRPFSELAIEFLRMAVPMVRGLITGEWSSDLPSKPTTRAELLRLWDESTAELDRLWPQIPSHRFQEEAVAFGQFRGRVYTLLLYVIDNEIHHRGQGYVYLRALGIEPPPFWDRK